MIQLLAVSSLLAFCGLVSALAQGRWSHSWAALALPALLVLTAAQLSAVTAPVVVGLVFAVAAGAAWSGVLPAPVWTHVGNAAGSGVVVAVALALSRIAAGVAPLAAPVVMALVIAGSEVLGSRANPFGEWGSLAHSQARRPWARLVARREPAAVTAVLVLVSSCLGFAATQRSTPLLILGLVGVAVLTVLGYLANKRSSDPQTPGWCMVGLLEEASAFFAAQVGHFVTTDAVNDQWWSAFRQQPAAQHRVLLERTRTAGRAGADLVVWAEGAGLLAAADHPEALDATAQVARSTATYVVASWLVLDRDTALMDNVCTVIDPAGEVVLTRAKRFPVPGVESDRTVTRPQHDLEAVDTPFGRLTVLICFDADHAESWRQVIRCGADVVAIPASDWPQIGSLHADMALLRARSAAVAIIRPARGGVSVVATARGHVIAQQDHQHHNTPALLGAL